MARVLQAASLLLLSSLVTSQSIDCNDQDGDIYGYSFTALNSTRPINLADYSNKVVLFMNVATY
jgi:hypothetical protein